MVAAAKGYRLTMPDSMSQERQAMLKAYGAQLKLTPGTNGMRGGRPAEEITAKDSQCFRRNSFVTQPIPNPPGNNSGGNLG